MNAEWVTEAVRLGLCSPPGDWWINHVITQNQRFKDRTVGSLDRPTIEYFADKIDQARDAIGENNSISDQARKSAYADLNALAQAASVLEELKASVKEQHAQQQFSQGTIPFPPSPAPMMGPEAELTYKETGDPKEITGQTETDAGAIKESSEQAETTAELHEWEAGIVQINSDLLELVEHRESFVVALDRARGLLDQVRDPWAVKHITDTAEKLRAIADLLELGHDLEMRGKALRFDGFYKAGQLFESAPKGHQANGQLDPLGCFEQHEKKLIRLLRRLAPEDYRRLRDKGIENGSLSENTFKDSAPPKTPKEAVTPQYDPKRFAIDLAVDFRNNLELYYNTEGRAKELGEDPRMVENLGPVAEPFMHFIVAMCGWTQAKYAERDA